MPLTKEQLLIPRVMCVGTEEGKPNFPNSKYTTGQILYIHTITMNENDIPKYAVCIFDILYREFPNCFKPLPWWYGRKPEDMPEYVRIKSKILKVVKYRINDGEFVPEGKKIIKTLNGTTPATREEYEEYLKQKEGFGKCKEKGCDKEATKDYNGHGHFVCDAHYESLLNYFDEEYK